MITLPLFFKIVLVLLFVLVVLACGKLMIQSATKDLRPINGDKERNEASSHA